jgi:hypothetical protein
MLTSVITQARVKNPINDRAIPGPDEATYVSSVVIVATRRLRVRLKAVTATASVNGNATEAVYFWLRA